MFYNLIIAAAVIFSALMVLSVFYGDFPFFTYDDGLTQAICRALFVFCNVLILVAVTVYPEVILCSYVEGAVLFNFFIAVANMIVILIFEGLYWVANIIAICAVYYLGYLCKKLAGWTFKGDSGYFFDDYD